MKPLKPISFVLFLLFSCTACVEKQPDEAATAQTEEPALEALSQTDSKRNDEPRDSLRDMQEATGEHAANTLGPLVLLADVCPDIIQEIRYYTTFNFVGRRIPGYERPVAYLTQAAADSLHSVCEELKMLGYRLKVYDAYRPQRAVQFFIRWGKDLSDQTMKPYFYPDCPKSELFHRGYLAHRSGHARGSTVDVTLFDMKTQREVDMGSTYDFLGEASHYDYRQGLSADQITNRRTLREVMSKHGFKPISCEWWHFTLRNEPYPDRYFDYPIE